MVTSEPCKAGVLLYVQDHRLIVCTLCGQAVSSTQVRRHLHNEKHRLFGHNDPDWCARALRDIEQQDCISSLDELVIPAAPVRSITGLPVFHDALLCDILACRFVCRTLRHMQMHHKRVHSWSNPRSRGRPSSAMAATNTVLWKAGVSCQQFFPSGSRSQLFEVRTDPDTTLAPQKTSGTRTREEEVRHQTYLQLDQQRYTSEEPGDAAPMAALKTDVSPWLETTRWPNYLQGTKLSSVAHLAYTPDPVKEPLLHQLALSLDRVIEASHASLDAEKVNVFDQSRINSFIRRQKASDRPLLVKLQKNTYRKYKSLWKRLIAFTYRTAQPSMKHSLKHRLLAKQVAHLDGLVSCGNELLEALTAGFVHEDAHLEDIRVRLDHQCLLFCIALLDHNLKGDLFESVVVSFLAVLAIDEKKQMFLDAYSYTPFLSGLIKIAQLLVIQRAVSAAECGEADFPADLIDEMRERFLVYGSRSPMNWMLRLRSYGKQVRNHTTPLGYIQWSEDDQVLSYKNLTLSMADFRRFIREQVAIAQSQLEDLCLLCVDESRESTIPELVIHNISDDPTNNTRNWSFLNDPRNEVELVHRGDWLLNRVLDAEPLQRQFVNVSNSGRVIWKAPEAKKYLARVDAFLERLLLLVHLTSGQPARGTELVGLRYKNTMSSHLRDVFIEAGAVTMVTAYHKGYSITGSTKIIHRYLPREVGELMIYYLWLVRPFWQRLEKLALYQTEEPSPYIWSKKQGTWDSKRLGDVLDREFRARLGTPANIAMYRHAAIAISRKFLDCGGFKRDYDVDEKKADLQAAHSSWTASSIYARGIEEAAGHVQLRRAEFRKVSRQWHEFLGFSSFRAVRKRPLGELEINAVERIESVGETDYPSLVIASKRRRVRSGFIS